MKHFLFLTFILATGLVTHAEVKIALGDITDQRTTGDFFGGLDVSLKVSGPELKNCKGLRVVMNHAKDDMGRTIKVKENAFNDGGFEEPQKAFGGFGDNQAKEEEFELKLNMENPERSAKSFSVDAVVELLVPEMDPKAVVTADVAKVAGQPLANDAIKAAGASITLQAPKDDEISYTLSDPNKKVASVEFFSADGKALETGGRMSSMFLGKQSMSVSLVQKPPAGVLAKIYLVTDKSVVRVPLKLPDVKLP